ncbi:MAG TPA: isochorismatase family cysteine hydrolase [Metabacillus sp.]|nr:isochorismatase family cysteine hydrolase [Metabacillus sp.]
MNKALLVLDIQNDFISNEARMPVAKHQVEPMLSSINSVIKKADHLDIPVIYIGNEFEPEQVISNWLRRNSAIKGSEGAKLDKRLTIVNNLYYSKNTANALSNLELVSYLHENDLEHLIIVGVFTEGCVSATTNSAIRENFSVTVVEDAVGV